MEEKQRSGVLSGLFIFSAVIVIFSSMCIWVIMDIRSGLIETNITERLLADSVLAAELATGEELSEIVRPEDVKTPLYAELKGRLAAFAERADVARAYFARETEDGRLAYIVDSKRGAGAEGVAGASREMHTARDVLLRAFDGESAAQGIGVYVEGAEGSISAFSPVFDAEGNVVAVAGVDLPDANIVLLNNLGAISRVVIVLAIVLSVVSGVANLVTYRRVAERAAVANASKSAFLAAVSHEMRTPLNAIIGFSELALTEGNLNRETEGTLKNIHTAGETLLGTINDVLNLSKLESGKQELMPVEYDLPSLINDVVVFNAVRIGEKPIRFIVDVDPNMPSRLFGDDLRVRQICNNLLSNAFKYTRQGTVTWHVSSKRDGADRVGLRLKVTDTGIGIGKEDLEKLFTDYSRVNVSSNRKIEGTGLGLSLTKRMIEMMDGNISVESEEGKGSVFTVCISQGFVTDVPVGEEVANNLMNHHYMTQRRIDSLRFARIPMPYAAVLVVDDNESNLEIAKGVFKPYKMRIDCVTSGTAAIDLIRKEEIQYSAIFMDHMMPNMDGIEATRVIRQDIDSEYARTVPVIALTANAIAGNEEMFLANGFQAFLTKPIDVTRVDAVLREWVRDEKRESELEIPKTAGTEPKSDSVGGAAGDWDVEGLNAAKALSRLGGDAEIYARVLETYVRTTRPLMEKLRVVTEAGLAEYGIIVHGLKSSGRSIGAERLGDLAEALEFAVKRGDSAFVAENNEAFLGDLKALIDGIERKLGDLRAQNAKPRRSEPDPARLRALAAACADFDIDAADAEMGALRDFDYDEGEDLIEWLTEQMGVSAYRQIVERLEGEGY